METVCCVKAGCPYTTPKYLSKNRFSFSIIHEEGLYGAVKNEWAKAIVSENGENSEKNYQAGLKRLQDLGMEKALADLTKLINDFYASN